MVVVIAGRETVGPHPRKSRPCGWRKALTRPLSEGGSSAQGSWIHRVDHQRSTSPWHVDVPHRNLHCDLLHSRAWLGQSKKRSIRSSTCAQTDANILLPLPALVAVVPKDKLTINGPTKSWAGKGSSGKDVHRIFCSECGSPIAHDPDAAPEIIALKAGTLDTEIKKNLKPDTEIWTKSKLPFMKESLAKPFEGMPE